MSLLLLQLALAPGSVAPFPVEFFSRSTPSPPLSWIELAPTVFSLVCLAPPPRRMRMPSPTLNAISFWSAVTVRPTDRSPMSIFLVSWSALENM